MSGHSSYDHRKIVADSQLVVDTQNTAKGMGSEKDCPLLINTAKCCEDTLASFSFLWARCLCFGSP